MTDSSVRIQIQYSNQGSRGVEECTCNKRTDFFFWTEENTWNIHPLKLLVLLYLSFLSSLTTGVMGMIFHVPKVCQVRNIDKCHFYLYKCLSYLYLLIKNLNVLDQQPLLFFTSKKYMVFLNGVIFSTLKELLFIVYM